MTLDVPTNTVSSYCEHFHPLSALHRLTNLALVVSKELLQEQREGSAD